MEYKRIQDGVIPELSKIVQEYYESGTPCGIVVAGAIAAGKTTTANTIGYFLSLPIIHENFRKNPYFFGEGGYLEKLSSKAYEDEVFVKSQEWFIRSKAQQIFDRMWKYKIGYSSDRAPDGDKPFFDNLKAQGLINQEQYNRIMKVFNTSLNRLSPYMPVVNIANIAKPPILKERNDLRARNDESRIAELDYPVEYFADLAPLFLGMAEVWRARGTLILNDVNKTYETVGEKDETRFKTFPESIQYELARVLTKQLDDKNVN
jgi:deoxyadenosine/deoxycytidine kinase